MQRARSSRESVYALPNNVVVPHDAESDSTAPSRHSRMLLEDPTNASFGDFLSPTSIAPGTTGSWEPTTWRLTESGTGMNLDSSNGSSSALKSDLVLSPGRAKKSGSMNLQVVTDVNAAPGPLSEDHSVYNDQQPVSGNDGVQAPRRATNPDDAGASQRPSAEWATPPPLLPKLRRQGRRVIKTDPDVA